MSASAPVSPRGRIPLVYEFRVLRRPRLSQRELGERAGLAQETISRIETGQERPRRLTAWSIARALGQDPRAVFPDFEELR